MSTEVARIDALATALHQSAANGSAFDRTTQFMPHAFIRRVLELLHENGYCVVPATAGAAVESANPRQRRDALRAVMRIAGQRAIELACEPSTTVLPRDYATELYEHRIGIGLAVSIDVDDREFIANSPEHTLLLGGSR